MSIATPQTGGCAVRSRAFGPYGSVWRRAVRLRLGAVRPASTRVSFQSLRATLIGIDAGVLPPGCFVADAMHQPMMDAAERDREFVAGLAAERARLQVPQMMRIRGLAAADQAGLLGDVTKVLAVAIAARRRNGERALVDAGGLLPSIAPWHPSSPPCWGMLPACLRP